MSDQESFHPRWLVPLKVSEEMGRTYASVFQSPELEIVRDPEGNICLSSTRFDTVQERDNAKRIASSLLGVLNGYAQLIWPQIEPLRFTTMTRLNPDRTIDQRFITAVPRMSILTGGTDGIEEILFGVRPPTGALTPLSEPVRAAIQDPEVCHVLGIFGSGVPSWPELYVVLESIEASIGGSPVDWGWADSKDVNRFRATANDPWIGGDEARHGYTQQEPFSNPMDLREARTLIRQILASWIVHVGEEHLAGK